MSLSVLSRTTPEYDRVCVCMCVMVLVFSIHINLYLCHGACVYVFASACASVSLPMHASVFYVVPASVALPMPMPLCIRAILYPYVQYRSNKRHTLDLSSAVPSAVPGHHPMEESSESSRSEAHLVLDSLQNNLSLRGRSMVLTTTWTLQLSAKTTLHR